MEKKFTKNCPICGNIQSYTTKKRLSDSIKGNWMCNSCSRYNRKKNYDENTIDKILELYKESDKRGNSGVKGAYHLDHKFSIIEGFNKKINPEIIGNIKNLEFIPWEENIKKRTKCSITINELIT